MPFYLWGADKKKGENPVIVFLTQTGGTWDFFLEGGLGFLRESGFPAFSFLTQEKILFFLREKRNCMAIENIVKYFLMDFDVVIKSCFLSLT